MKRQRHQARRQRFASCIVCGCLLDDEVLAATGVPLHPSCRVSSGFEAVTP